MNSIKYGAYCCSLIPLMDIGDAPHSYIVLNYDYLWDKESGAQLWLKFQLSSEWFDFTPILLVLVSMLAVTSILIGYLPSVVRIKYVFSSLDPRYLCLRLIKSTDLACLVQLL